MQRERACLILVELTVLVLLLPLLLERNDHESDEDVDHEERNDDDVDDVEDRHCRSVVVDLAHPFFVRVNAIVHHTNTHTYTVSHTDTNNTRHKLQHIEAVM